MIYTLNIFLTANFFENTLNHFLVLHFVFLPLSLKFLSKKTVWSFFKCNGYSSSVTRVNLQSRVAVILILSTFPSFHFISSTAPDFRHIPLTSPFKRLFGNAGKRDIYRIQALSFCGCKTNSFAFCNVYAVRPVCKGRHTFRYCNGNRRNAGGKRFSNVCQPVRRKRQNGIQGRVYYNNVLICNYSDFVYVSCKTVLILHNNIKAANFDLRLFIKQKKEPTRAPLK